MAYSATAVANAFIKLAAKDGVGITPMHLQKLVFLSNGWMLGVLGKPLVSDSFEVWKYGPVNPELYQSLKKYGKGEVKSSVTTWKVDDDDDFITVIPSIPDKDKDVHALLETVWKAYKDVDAITLSNITHLPGAPWTTTLEKSGYNSSIPNEVIRDYYKGLMNQ